MAFENESFSDLYLNPPVSDGPTPHQWKVDGEVRSLPEEYHKEADLLYRTADVLGRGVFCLNHGKLRFRGQALDHMNGRTIVLRRLIGELPRWTDLGYPSGTLSALLKGDPSIGNVPLLQNKAGLVFVSGETDAGKSTTLAVLMRELLNLKPWVGVTIEDPVEYPLSGPIGHGYCYQQDVDAGRFHEALRDVLRVNPDVILLGEIRDPDTAATCLSAATTGHLVLTTVHAATVPLAIQRIVTLASQIRPSADVMEMLSACFVCGTHQSLQRVPGRNGGRRLSAQILLATNSVRSLIRQGRTDHLQGEIVTQGNILRPVRTAP